MATLNDLYHFVGNDVVASTTGDLQPVNGIQRGQQRILRRLLTNPGDYIFHTDYGAGLPAKIGDTANIPSIKALIRGQILLEEAVAKTPEPQIEVAAILGGISVTIRYADAESNTSAVLSFNVNQ